MFFNSVTFSSKGVDLHKTEIPSRIGFNFTVNFRTLGGSISSFFFIKN